MKHQDPLYLWILSLLLSSPSSFFAVLASSGSIATTSPLHNFQFYASSFNSSNDLWSSASWNRWKPLFCVCAGEFCGSHRKLSVLPPTLPRFESLRPMAICSIVSASSIYLHLRGTSRPVMLLLSLLSHLLFQHRWFLWFFWGEIVLIHVKLNTRCRWWHLSRALSNLFFTSDWFDSLATLSPLSIPMSDEPLCKHRNRNGAVVCPGCAACLATIGLAITHTHNIVLTCFFSSCKSFLLN